uniref:HTH CENPB-type domain-containing protein n=1 Tax=Chlorocebus sabaeus TaxID=60711 RepID=A0A0D9R2B0_CHLSB
VVCKCLSERKSHMSLILNQRLDMKISGEGMLKTEAGPLAPVKQAVNAKEKFLKQFRSTTSVTIVVCIEDETSHNIPLSQNLIQSKALTLFNSEKVQRVEEAEEEKFEASRGWFMRFKEISHLHDTKVQDEAASADGEATASSPENLAKINDEGSYTQQQVCNIDTTFYWKKMSTRTPIAREEKSMSSFKLKDKLILLLEANATGDFKFKPSSIYRSENPKALKDYAKSTLPVLYKRNLKAWKIAHLSTAWFIDYFKPSVRIYAQKKVTFKILLLIDNAPGHSRTLMQMYQEVNVVSMSVNTTCILQSMDQGIILTFKSYYLRRTFHKAIDSDSSDGSGHSKLKLWKGFTIPDAISNIHDSWKEVKISILAGVLKKLIPTLMASFERFKALVEEVTSGVLEIARKLESEVEPEDGTELLQSHDGTKEQSEIYILGEDARNIVERTTKDFEYYINLVDEDVAGFERINFNFERSSTGEMLTNSIAFYRIFYDR